MPVFFTATVQKVSLTAKDLVITVTVASLVSTPPERTFLPIGQATPPETVEPAGSVKGIPLLTIS